MHYLAVAHFLWVWEGVDRTIPSNMHYLAMAHFLWFVGCSIHRCICPRHLTRTAAGCSRPWSIPDSLLKCTSVVWPLVGWIHSQNPFKYCYCSSQIELAANHTPLREPVFLSIPFQISKYHDDREIREDFGSQQFYYGLVAMLFRDSLHLHPNIQTHVRSA